MDTPSLTRNPQALQHQMSMVCVVAVEAHFNLPDHYHSNDSDTPMIAVVHHT